MCILETNPLLITSVANTLPCFKGCLHLLFGFLCYAKAFKFIRSNVFIFLFIQFSHSVGPDSLQPHGLQHARLPCPITNFQSLLRLVSIESVMSSKHLVLCHSLRLLPSIFPSIRVFSNESILCIRWPKYWSLSVLLINIQD